MDNLLPCPLCGSKADIEYGSEFGDTYSEGPDGWTIYCTLNVCGLNIFQSSDLDEYSESDKEVAKIAIIKKWNMRVKKSKLDILFKKILNVV